MEGGNSRLVERVGFTTSSAHRVHPHGHGGREDYAARRTCHCHRRRQRLQADACICTVPARVSNRIVFDPPLPAGHRAAADKLQYARIVKNQILFKERFWGAEDFSLVSDVTSHYYFHSTKNQPGKQGILCSYAIGEKADVLASQSSGGAATSSPAICCHSTGTRRNSRAEHSINALATRSPTRKAPMRSTGRANGLRSARFCSRPHGKVLFAGEHLADWQGFMEGAVVTGEAAAQALKGRASRRRAA